jgi:hypothetical protein
MCREADAVVDPAVTLKGSQGVGDKSHPKKIRNDKSLGCKQNFDIQNALVICYSPIFYGSPGFQPSYMHA